MDWNLLLLSYYRIWLVALFTEGVDWNQEKDSEFTETKESPSSQRVWIEIKYLTKDCSKIFVALFTEGVDWNKHKKPNFKSIKESPSSQRVWIEIRYISKYLTKDCSSPSSQRVWIEILNPTTANISDEVALFTEGVDWNKDIQQ